MFLTKLLTQLIFPLDFSLAVLLAAFLLLLAKFRKTGLVLISFSVLWLWFWSTPVTADWVRYNLEQANPPVPVEKLPNADAIVVLGGGMGSAEPPRLYPDLNAAADRVWHAARLYKADKAPIIVLSGGRGVAEKEETKPESDAMGIFLADLGIPKAAILLESESRNTYENAFFTKRILDARGARTILLVTSALHMRRAKAIFDSFHFEVIPAATDYEVVTKAKRTPPPWLPDAPTLEGGSRALKEYLGFIAFRVRGK